MPGVKKIAENEIVCDMFFDPSPKGLEYMVSNINQSVTKYYPKKAMKVYIGKNENDDIYSQSINKKWLSSLKNHMYRIHILWDKLDEIKPVEDSDCKAVITEVVYDIGNNKLPISHFYLSGAPRNVIEMLKKIK